MLTAHGNVLKVEARSLARSLTHLPLLLPTPILLIIMLVAITSEHHVDIRDFQSEIDAFLAREQQQHATRNTTYRKTRPAFRKVLQSSLMHIALQCYLSDCIKLRARACGDPAI
jgi:hypothetical protein